MRIISYLEVLEKVKKILILGGMFYGGLFGCTGLRSAQGKGIRW